MASTGSSPCTTSEQHVTSSLSDKMMEQSAASRSTAKRIAPGAYQALREALPVVHWYRRNFETFLRACLRDHAELLAPLNFQEPKRQVADVLLDRLVSDEHRYREVTLNLMIALSDMATFPDIAAHEDAARLLPRAQAAAQELKRWVGKYADDVEERARLESERSQALARSASLRKFSDEMDTLRSEFLRMHSMEDVRSRGTLFEGFLARLLALFDLEPRLSYALEREQIDGSLSFDTDDYIVEARWRSGRASREDADAFNAKVRRRGKNALGLFVSVNGFTTDAIAEYGSSTSFLAMDGTHLMAVLEQRVRLDDLLRRMKRHANDTGQCYLAPARILD
ncbi:MAG: restriction endonuclease [Candidatus Dormibacteria bacterium]